jgi:hypothetical protein
MAGLASAFMGLHDRQSHASIQKGASSKNLNILFLALNSEFRRCWSPLHIKRPQSGLTCPIRGLGRGIWDGQLLYVICTLTTYVRGHELVHLNFETIIRCSPRCSPIHKAGCNGGLISATTDANDSCLLVQDRLDLRHYYPYFCLLAVSSGMIGSYKSSGPYIVLLAFSRVEIMCDSIYM